MGEAMQYSFMRSRFRKGPENPLLRPICWTLGHGIYHAQLDGWSDTKFQCPRCGMKHSGPAPECAA